MTSAQKGELALLKVLVRANELGWVASRPTRDCRYDLVLDDGKQLHRVQVKYCNRRARELCSCRILPGNRFVCTSPRARVGGRLPGMSSPDWTSALGAQADGRESPRPPAGSDGLWLSLV